MSAIDKESAEEVARQTDTFVERMRQAAGGTFEIFSIYLFYRLRRVCLAA